MKISIRKSPMAIITTAVLAFVVVFGGTVANAASSVNVPVTASSQVAVTNITETTTSTSIRVQFDYALVNGATTALVDAAYNDQRSFGQVTVTGAGHFDETLSGITVNSSTQTYIVSTGNPDFLIPTNTCNTNSNLFSYLVQLIKNVSQLFFQYF
jgi:hypothetical protein